MKLTDEQLKILDCKDDMIIEAKAGCGKTSTLIQYGLRYPEKKKVYLAFNSSIKTEADEKFKKAGVKNITCTTVHSLGHTYAIKSGKFKLGYNPTAYHISKLFGLTDRKDQAVITYSIRLFETFCFSNFNSIEELNYQDYLVTDKAKDFFLDNKKPIEGFGKMIWDNMINKKLDCSHSFYLKYYQLSKPKLNYDILLFDECLPYHTPILLSDGTSLPIGKIVDDKLNVSVLTYNTETKQQEICKVTNWQRNPNNKRMLKIGLSVKNKNKRSQRFIVCTDNHKIWADDNWIQAGDLKIGMKCQFETSAQISNKYKITSKGRNSLSKLMLEKNINQVMVKDDSNRKGTIKKSTKGGNGKLTASQVFLKERLALLGLDFEYEKAIPTKGKHSLPNSIKLDLSNSEFKIAIELDGHSHNSKSSKERDERKDLFLKESGWKVFRIKNLDVFKNIEEIEKNIYNETLISSKCENGIDCPIDCYINSIDEIDIPEPFTYDLTVEKNHNFYANGVLVHNCQDSDLVMLDIFYNQAGQKIMVGDSHQAIYAWRGAINSLASAPEHFKKFYLTNSFRFPQSIADLGVSVLMNKFSLNPLLDENLEINGKGFKSKIETRAIISRSNLALLDTLFSEKFAYRKPFIEGGIENLINTNSGVSILDLYYLSVGKKSEIKNAFVKGFKSIEDMKQYYEELDDTSINSGINFIRKYGGNLIFELEELKERIVDKESLADYAFSTIHKAKGKEWDEVTLLAPDVWDEGFPTSIPDRILKNVKASGESTYEILTEDKKKILLKKWIEELNIYYVGITRAKVKINHDLVWLEQQKETNGISDEQFEQQLEIEGKPNTEGQTETFFKSNPDLSFTHNENRVDFKYKSVSGRINSFSISKDDLIDMCKKIFENRFII